VANELTSRIEPVSGDFFTTEISPENIRRRVVRAVEHESTDIPLSDIYIDGRLDLYPEVSAETSFAFIQNKIG
jgi:hypothetical protein